MYLEKYLNIRQFVHNHYTRIFWGILFIAFLLRVFVTYFAGFPWFSVDSYSYLQMADSIVNGEPFSRFPNGFPLLIAFFKVWLPTVWIPPAIVTINVFLSTALVGLGINIAKKMSGNAVLACLAGLLIAVYPNQLNYVRQILSETPTTFFLVLSVFLFFKRTYFLSGFFLVITITFRSSLLPLLPLMIACFYFFEQGEKLKTEFFKFTGGMVVMITIYTSLLSFGIIKPSNNLQANILIAMSSYGGDINYTLDGLSSADFNHPIQSYLSFAIEQPIEFLKQRALSFSELWLWPSDGVPPRSFITKLLIALRIPVLIGAIIEFSRNIKKTEVWLLFLPIVIITAIHTLFFSTPRFTYVIEPFAIILAVVGFFELFSIHQKDEEIRSQAV